MTVNEYGMFLANRDTAMENRLHEIKAVLDEDIAVQERTITVLHTTELVGLLIMVSIAANILYTWATRRKVRSVLEQMRSLAQGLGK